VPSRRSLPHVSLTVRFAEVADAPQIAAVHVRAWQEGYRGLLSDELLTGLSIEQRTQRWATGLAATFSDDSAARVAELDGRIVGFATIVAPSRDEDAGEGVAELASLNVDPSAWRAGVGSALITESFAALDPAKWPTVTLWVLEGNARAIALYERFGFTFDGTRQLITDLGAAAIERGAADLRMRRGSRA